MSADDGVSKRVLSPIDRLSEVIFGLIMALSFTLSISVATAGREDVHEMLIGALGCNTAWGIVDGVMFVIAALLIRNKELAGIHAIRASSNAAQGVRALAESLPDYVATAIGTDGLERVRAKVAASPEPPTSTSIQLNDLKGALACFLLVFLSTLPVALPFALIQDPIRALRISNLIAIVLLYVAGHALGKWAGFRPWRSGLVMVVIGTILTLFTIALGG